LTTLIDFGKVLEGLRLDLPAAEENNAENLLVIKERKLAEQYTKNWKEHKRHSETYGEKGK